MAQPDLSHPKYRPDIDGLRAVAVLSVVIYHASPYTLKGGFAGVDVFFVISGFLISTIIFENLNRATFSFGEFYARRVRRIFPALFVVLASCYAAGWYVLLADEFSQLGKHIVSGAGFVSNIVLWRESGYFDTIAETKPLLHLWSLGVEEQFYIVWPLLLWAVWKRRLGFIITALVIALASFYMNVSNVKVDQAATFYLPLTRLWELLTGSMLAWVVLNRNGVRLETGNRVGEWLGSLVETQTRWANSAIVLNLISLAGALLLAYGFWRINKTLAFPGKWAVLPVVGTALLMFAGPTALINRFVLSNRIAVWFGVISYPLYLWHWPILAFARIIEGGTPTLNMRRLCVVAAIALAWLTYRLVERPIRFGGNSRMKVAAMAALMIVMGAVGVGTVLKGGLPSRLPAFVVTSPDYPCPPGHLVNEVCEVGNRAAAKTIVAYGDSHLNHLLRQIVDKLGEDHAINIVYSSGCFMGDKVRIHGADIRPECDHKVEALERMKGSKPFAVITAQRWQGYDVVTKESVTVAIKDRLNVFGMMPEKLIILGSTANAPIECEKSRLRPLDRLKVCPQDEDSKAINRTFIEATSQMAVPANVSFVYPYRTLCPNDVCVFSQNGVSNYFDFNHMTYAGAEGAAREINAIIRR